MWIRSNLRVVLGVLAVTGVVVAGLASRSGAQPGTSSAAIACPAVGGSKATIACGFPIWCCPGGAMPGVTVTGQATLQGSSAQVRDEAIRRAVADARRQADAAANAAGIKLGQVLSMQISCSGWPYPLEANAGAAVGSGGQAIASPAPVPPSVICDRQSGCMAPSPVSVQTFVSVTVTWAIA